MFDFSLHFWNKNYLKKIQIVFLGDCLRLPSNVYTTFRGCADLPLLKPGWRTLLRQPRSVGSVPCGFGAVRFKNNAFAAIYSEYSNIWWYDIYYFVKRTPRVLFYWHIDVNANEWAVKQSCAVSRYNNYLAFILSAGPAEAYHYKYRSIPDRRINNDRVQSRLWRPPFQ